MNDIIITDYELKKIIKILQCEISHLETSCNYIKWWKDREILDIKNIIQKLKINEGKI
jgi:hypothetical protein